MSPQKLPGGILFGFSLIVLLFVSLYVILSIHNRPAADDFYFLQSVRDSGIWNTMAESWQKWITRWTAILFLGAAIKFFDVEKSFIWYQLFTLLAVFGGIVFLLKRLAEMLHLKLSFIHITLFASLFVVSFFMLSFDTGENWFWFTSTGMYLWPVIALIWGSYFLLKAGNRFYLIPIVLLFLFAGGGSEVVALEACLFLGMLFIGNRFLKSTFDKTAIIFALLSIVLALFIAWLGYGRIERQSSLPDLSLLGQLVLALKSSLYFLFANLTTKVQWLFFFIVPWMWFGYFMRDETHNSIGKAFGSVARYLLFFLAFVFIHFVITICMLKSFPPARTWITLSLGLSILCMVSGMKLGEIIDLKVLKFLSFVFIIVTGIVFIYLINTQYQVTGAYANGYDERMKSLKSVSTPFSVIEVNPLPESGMLYSAEITSDTGNFKNRLLKNYLQLKVPVLKK